MWDELIKLLNAEVNLCQQLLSLSNLQTQYLIAGSTAQAIQIAKQQEDIMHTISAIELKKRAFFSNGRGEETVSFEQVIHSAPAEEKKNLLRLTKLLELMTKEIKEQNEQNRHLFTKMMQFIDFSINLITQTTADDIYAPKGQSGSVIAKKKLFDQTI